MKNTIKKILIILGIAITAYSILHCLIEASFDITRAIDYYFEYYLGIVILNPISLITILGPIMIIIGTFLDTNDKNIQKNKEEVEKQTKKYRTFILLGYLPFLGVISYGFFSMLTGFSFLNSTAYGFEALISSTLLLSILLWPLYIIGIILIVYSSIKLTKIVSKNQINNK